MNEWAGGSLAIVPSALERDFLNESDKFMLLLVHCNPFFFIIYLLFTSRYFLKTSLKKVYSLIFFSFYVYVCLYTVCVPGA